MQVLQDSRVPNKHFVPHLAPGCTPCESGKAMQQAMSCAGCCLFVVGQGIAALPTNRLQVDTIRVLLRHAWALHRVHKPSTACSETVDLL